MASRQQRLDRKYRDSLRCEACNRWTSVSSYLWRKISRDERGNRKSYVYFCDRDRCIKTRPEGLAPEDV